MRVYGPCPSFRLGLYPVHWTHDALMGKLSKCIYRMRLVPRPVLGPEYGQDPGLSPRSLESTTL